MIRIGLVTYLMISTLAGQAWCCCFLDRLPLPTVFFSADGETAPTTPKRSCCCQPQTEPQREEASNPAKPDEPSGPTDSCPCKDQRSNQSLPVSFGVHTDEQVRSTSLVFDYSHGVLFSDVVGDAMLHQFDRGLDPSRTYYLSGAELLCALQTFRC